MTELRRKSPRRRDARGGFIVVTALWILGALATLVGVFALYISASAVNTGVHADRLRVEALVRAGLELAAHRMTADDDRSRTSGGFGFRSGGANVNVMFRGEAARIDLNKAPKELLAGLFRELGASGGDAEEYAARVVGWRTRPPAGATGEEPSHYRSAGLRYAARQNPFPHVAELAHVVRLPEAIAVRAMPFVTVYSGEAGVNIDIAEREVLGALPGMSGERLERLLELRNRPNPERTIPAFLGADVRFITGAIGAATRVTVRADFGDAKRMITEVVMVAVNGDSEPYRVLSWTDDADVVAVDGRGGAGAQ